IEQKHKNKASSLVGPGLTPFYTLHPHCVTCRQFSPYTCQTSTATLALFSSLILLYRVASALPRFSQPNQSSLFFIFLLSL
ncbi:hypothetical protein VIGAN_11256700, partial [Vigna angularis var. angularis]